MFFNAPIEAVTSHVTCLLACAMEKESHKKTVCRNEFAWIERCYEALNITETDSEAIAQGNTIFLENLCTQNTSVLRSVFFGLVTKTPYTVSSNHVLLLISEPTHSTGMPPIFKSVQKNSFCQTRVI